MAKVLEIIQEYTPLIPSIEGSGGIYASQVIRLIGNIYSQTMRIYICGELYRIFVNIKVLIISDFLN
ncbi:hypothetical protein H4J57_13270 [Colwellia sp. BRX8-7]|uniref:hypothetical protein n=1 Tax=Colwellia sp. BRX8-7 TaxID=2759833 RepID=UPI0015F3C85F|nr:hypothetical protein [Colwellia sp. BRX8-7]MBA6338169.1 hypothetical protein [Colwellia sp. BRX8-7]